MNIQSQINSPACAGEAAGHDAAVCISACGKCDGASVCDARDARVPSPTTLPLQVRQVVAPQAQNFGADAAVIELTINPTIKSAGNNTSAASTINPTIESAGSNASAASTSKGSTKGKITAFFVMSAANGRAGRSAVSGPPAPSVPSVSISVLTPAGITPFDAVAPSVPSVSISVLTPAGVTPFDAVAPAVPSVSMSVLTPAGVTPFDAVAPAVPSVSMPVLTPAGITPFDAVAPAVPFVSPPVLSRAASTNDSPIPQPTGTAAASTNESTSKTWPYVDRLAKPGIKLIAAAGTKALPVQTPDSPVSTNNTSPTLGRAEGMPKVTIEESVKEMPKVTIEESAKEMPQVTIEESVNETPKATIKKSKERMRANKKSKKQASEAKVNSPEDRPTIYYNPYQEYSNPEILTAKEDRAYRHAKDIMKTGHFYEPYHYAEVAPTPDVPGPSSAKPRTLSSRLPPQTPPMSRLEKEAAKIARNTPKTVLTLPAPLPQAVEAEQAPTTGVPPVPVPLDPSRFDPAPLPQAVEAEQAPTTGVPPVPVPLDPARLPQDVETAGFPTPEPTTPPLETGPPAQVPLTGAQKTVANTARNRMLDAERLFCYQQSLNSPERLISKALNSAARTSIYTQTTHSQHVRLQKRNLTALSVATRELSTFNI